MSAQSPTLPARTLANMDAAALRSTGFTGGRRHLFNAVNADRRAAGLPAYSSMDAVPLDEAFTALQARMVRR